MKFLLLIADLVGLGRNPDAGSRLLFFTVWPKERRIRYWIPEISKIMVLRSRLGNSEVFYEVRFFHKSGWKENYVIAEQTLAAIRKTSIDIVESPRIEPGNDSVAT